jgi:hypothetical protein
MTRHTWTHRNRPQAYAKAQETEGVEEMLILITLVICSALTIGINLATFRADFKIYSPLSFAPASEPAPEPAHVPPPPMPLPGRPIRVSIFDKSQ